MTNTESSQDNLKILGQLKLQDFQETHKKLEQSVGDCNLADFSIYLSQLTLEANKLLDDALENESRERLLDAAKAYSQILLTSTSIPPYIESLASVNKFNVIEKGILKSLCQSANNLSKCCYFLSDNPPPNIEPKVLDNVSLASLNLERHWALIAGDEISAVKACGNIAMINARIAQSMFDQNNDESRKKGIEIINAAISKMEANTVITGMLERNFRNNHEISLKYIANFWNHLGSLYTLRAENDYNPMLKSDDILKAREIFKEGVERRLGLLKFDDPELKKQLEKVKMATYSNLVYTYILEFINDSLGKTDINKIVRNLHEVSPYLNTFLTIAAKPEHESNKKYFQIETDVRLSSLVSILFKLRRTSDSPTLGPFYFDPEETIINSLLSYLGNKELSLAFGEIKNNKDNLKMAALIKELGIYYLLRANAQAYSQGTPGKEDKRIIDKGFGTTLSLLGALNLQML